MNGMQFNNLIFMVRLEDDDQIICLDPVSIESHLLDSPLELESEYLHWFQSIIVSEVEKPFDFIVLAFYLESQIIKFHQSLFDAAENYTVFPETTRIVALDPRRREYNIWIKCCLLGTVGYIKGNQRRCRGQFFMLDSDLTSLNFLAFEISKQYFKARRSRS
jgi:hypothetical protein